MLLKDKIWFLQQQQIDFIDNWPSKSPDLDLIEHLHDNLDGRIRSHTYPPTNFDKLYVALPEEWYNIPQAEISAIQLSHHRCL